MDTTVGFPLVLDPQAHLATALDLRRQSLASFVFDLKAWMRWLRSFIKRRRQYKITGHYSEVPAVAIVAPGGEVTWLHRGTSIGDYPAISEVLDEMRRNTCTA